MNEGEWVERAAATRRLRGAVGCDRVERRTYEGSKARGECQGVLPMRGADSGEL